jgi:hypothetical protein
MLRMVGRVSRHDTDNCSSRPRFLTLLVHASRFKTVQASVIAECSAYGVAVYRSIASRPVCSQSWESELRVMAFPHGECLRVPAEVIVLTDTYEHAGRVESYRQVANLATIIEVQPRVPWKPNAERATSRRRR